MPVCQQYYCFVDKAFGKNNIETKNIYMHAFYIAIYSYSLTFLKFQNC